MATARKLVQKPPKKVADKVKNNIGLTAEQEAYARCRAMAMSIEESIPHAGLSINVAAAKRWEKMPALQHRINELAQQLSENAIINSGLDRTWVISRLMTVVDRCMQEQPVLDKKGQPTGQYVFNAAGANQALRMLGDTLGMFKPAEKKPEDEFAHLSDDELARLTAELAQETGLIDLIASAKAQAEHEQVIEVQALPAPD